MSLRQWAKIQTVLWQSIEKCLVSFASIYINLTALQS